MERSAEGKYDLFVPYVQYVHHTVVLVNYYLPVVPSVQFLLFFKFSVTLLLPMIAFSLHFPLFSSTV